MRLEPYLERMGIPYEMHHHETAWTAQDLAEREHVSGHRVVKPVLVRADGQLLLCALPASHRVNLDALRDELGCEQIALVDEVTLEEVFDGCEVGAEPPIGAIFGVPTVMDESLFGQDRVMFQAGSHSEAVTISLADYRRIAQPGVAQFGTLIH